MIEFFQTSVYMGVFLSLSSYLLGDFLKKKFKLGIFNPILIGVAVTIAVLVIFRIDYSVYYEGTKYISYLLTPATVCLAIPLYEQFELLKKNILAVMVGVLSGVLSSVLSVAALVLFFGLDHGTYVTFLPKSITTAIGMSVSEELGGYVSLTVAVIIITGIVGNVFAEWICKTFRITEPIAKGIAIGSASHALGTAKAMEMGEVEGAMSSLSIVVSGMLTVVAAILLQNLV